MSNFTGNVFDDMNTESTDSAEVHFGGVDLPSSGRIVAKPIPLSEITPDARQPRRVVPTSIRQLAPDAPPMTLLELWRKEIIKQTRLRELEPERFIMGKESDIEEVSHPLLAQLLKLYALAASIYKDGLLNPITIAPDGENKYILETGERRFLAYNLLAKHADFNKYNKIPARIMDKHDIWRQAHENNNRDDLNSVQKSRQVALLLMSMWEDEMSFTTYPESESDRAFYAQAYELNSRRGEGQRLLDAMGVNNRGSITMYKRLLRLPDEAWVRGDAENLSLNELLTILDEKEGTNYGRTNASNVYHDKHNSDESPQNDTPDNPPSPAPEPERPPAYTPKSSPFSKVDPPNMPTIPDPENTFEPGQYVQTPEGSGRVMSKAGANVTVRHNNGSIISHHWRKVSLQNTPRKTGFNDTTQRFPPSDEVDIFTTPQDLTIDAPVKDSVGRIGKVIDLYQHSGAATVNFIGSGNQRVDISSLDIISDDEFNAALTAAIARESSYKRFDRVDTEWGQGVITAVRGNEFTVVTMSELGSLDTRVFPAADLDPLRQPRIGDYAITGDGIIGKISRIDADNSGLDIRTIGDARTITLSAHEVSILYDYQPEPAAPAPAATDIDPAVMEKIHVFGMLLQTDNENHPALDYLGWLLDPTTPPADPEHAENMLKIALDNIYEEAIAQVMEHSANARAALEPAK